MPSYDKILRDHRVWIAESQGEVEQELEFLYEDFSSITINAFNNISHSMGRLANFYGIKGVVSASDGSLLAGNDISRSLVYRYWKIRVRAKAYSQTRFLGRVGGVINLTHLIIDAGCLLAACIAADRDEMAFEVADTLAKMLSIDGVANSKFVSQRTFEPFMIWLYSLYSGKKLLPDDRFTNLGVYQEVIDSWESQDMLPSLLDDLCEYHLKNNYDTGKGRKPEFDIPPFDLLFFEILAINLVREKSGFAALKPSSPHYTFTDSIAGKLSLEPDELILELESVYNDFFGM